MGIKIKHKDPKSTDFSPSDIIVNVKDGSLFYKSTTGLFKVQGDNVNTTNVEDNIIGENITVNSITASGNISASGDTSTITSATGSFNTMAKQIMIIPFAYRGNSTTSENYIPIKYVIDDDLDKYYHLFQPPYNGRLKKITISFVGGTGNPGNTTARIRKDAGGDMDLDEASDIVEAITITSLTQNTSHDFNFSEDATFAKSNIVAFTMETTESTVYDVVGSIVLELDTST